MPRWPNIAALAVLLLLLSGCTAARVEVNAYSEGQTKLAPGQKLSLSLQPAKPPANQLLDKEIAAKLAKALRGLGHRIDEGSDLVMTYEYTVGPAQQQSELRPFRVSRGWEYVGYTDQAGKRHYRPVSLSDETRYLSVNVTVFPKRLMLRLVRQEGGRLETLWAADASLKTYTEDLRQDIDYLIVAGLEKLGQDTGQAVNVDLDFGDERVKKLRGK